MGVGERDVSFVHQRQYSSKHRVINTTTDIGEEEMRQDAESVISNSSMRWWRIVSDFLHHFDSSTTRSGACFITTVSEYLDGNTSTIINNSMELTLINTLAQYGIAFLVLGIMIRYFMIQLSKQEARNIEMHDRFIALQDKSFETQMKLAWSVDKLSERIDRLASGVKCVNYAPRGE